jgi:hypothetical protein
LYWGALNGWLVGWLVGCMEYWVGWMFDAIYTIIK